MQFLTVTGRFAYCSSYSVCYGPKTKSFYLVSKRYSISNRKIFQEIFTEDSLMSSISIVEDEKYVYPSNNKNESTHYICKW